MVPWKEAINWVEDQSSLVRQSAERLRKRTISGPGTGEKIIDASAEGPASHNRIFT